MKPHAALSSDIDTLESIYKGRGLRQSEYSHDEFHIGLENFARFLEPFGVKATLFMVGRDLERPRNAGAARAMAAAGHEIANHTYTHAQGFRLLDGNAQEREIASMEDACIAATGTRPVGFRSPGWNMSDAALPILERRGYLYDSSINPTALTPLLKALHWLSTRRCDAIDRTTLGQWDYMFAPARPYRIDGRRLARRGTARLIEFPLSVVPVVRLPFWATFLLSTGLDVFRASYRLIRAAGLPIHYEFHLSDFVDYRAGELSNQVPTTHDGVYVPKSLRMPLQTKLDIFSRALSMIAADYDFVTLKQWATTPVASS